MLLTAGLALTLSLGAAPFIEYDHRFGFNHHMRQDGGANTASMSRLLLLPVLVPFVMVPRQSTSRRWP